MYQIFTGDCVEQMIWMDDASVHCCVTSPPYYGLRDYGVDGQIGLEATPDEYVSRMVEVFREVRRVLRDDGTLWLNLGDSYSGGGGFSPAAPSNQDRDKFNSLCSREYKGRRATPGLKQKDLLGIPWRVAFALQADGWYLRQDIIWCLSGGTVLYARTQKGDMPATMKDLARLDPKTVKLWNGERWTQVLGWSKTGRNADELEIVLRSGERIACTPTHQFPTDRGLLPASSIAVGDRLVRVRLPEPECPKRPEHVGEDAAWLAGLYLAEGSMSGDTIQIAGHVSQTHRLARLRVIASAYGGSVTCTVDGSNQSIRVYGKLLVAIVSELVSGKTAKDKCIAPVCWRYSNAFLRAMLDGYLSGDGHHDEGNNRWRLGFTRNYNLERDLRVLSARLGFKLSLSPVFVDGFGERWPAFRGEIRFETSGHHNEKDTAEVVEIRKSRCREVYDVGVEDEPHLFALGSGILSHNSKPNPMPESVKDRCTKAHEYLFLLSKSPRYYFDAEAIKESSVSPSRNITITPKTLALAEESNGLNRNGTNSSTLGRYNPTGRNKRSVWTVTPKPFKGAHFAVMPEDLVEPCVLAGTSERGCCASCGSPWKRKTESTRTPTRPGADTKVTGDPMTDGNRDPLRHVTETVTVGWEAGCTCQTSGTRPCTVLDPFTGSGTVAVVANRHGRDFIGCELNPEYVDITHKRITSSLPMEV